MALRHLLMLCTLTALALSGCAGGPEAPTAEGVGVPEGPSAGRAEAGAEAAAEAPPVTVQPFSKDGTTWTGACVYTGVGYQCTPTPGDGWLVIQGEGLLQSVRGVVRWEPQADYELRLYLLTLEENGWAWSQGDPVAASATGQLEFDWDVAGDEVDEVMLSLNAYTGVGAMVGAAGASVPFDFRLEGEARSLAAS